MKPETIEREQDSNPAYPHINEELNRYEYESEVLIDGELEPIHGGKIRRQNAE
jgi:hypothetical protein